MRRVAQLFEFVVVRRALGLLAGNQILDRHQSVGTAHPRHLGDYFRRLRKMMNRKAADDDVELAVLEWQARLDVALAEADVGDSALLAHLLGQLERRLGQGDADEFAGY